jgi:protein-tyrosine phosphatase
VEPKRVLFVCTGNICRSPAAELLVRGPLAMSSRGITSASAGTQARSGEAVDATMAAVLARHSVPTEPFVARRLTERIAVDADLVLTMTREQRSAVVRLAPLASRRTFTLLELAHIVGLAPESLATFAEVVTWAGANRGAAVLTTPAAQLDIDDPYGAPSEAHERAYQQIESALVRALPRLAEGVQA